MTSWAGAMLSAALLALSHVGAWPAALLGFLVRGGIVVLLLPIVVIPTTSGLANVVAPSLVPLVFGQPSPGLLALVASIVGALVAWLVIGGLVGAWCDLQLVREAAADEDVGLPVRAGRAAVVRGFAARLLAHLPLVVALSWGVLRIVDAVYRQLVQPDELTTPILLRVLRDVPDAVGLIVATWLLGEAWGGIAQRRIALLGEPLPRALAGGLLHLVRRPLSSVATSLLTTSVVALGVVPSALATGVAWNAIAVLLADRPHPLALAAALAVFVVLWLTTLLLTSVLTAWRAFAWTLEVARRLPRADATGSLAVRAGGGTIGGVGSGRPGEWPSGGASGTL